MIAERQENPTDDLTSVLVHAEIDGEKLEEHEIVMGFFLLVAAGNDSTKATYTSGMRALLEHPDQMKMLVDDPSLIPAAVEECLRRSGVRPLSPDRDPRHRDRRPADRRGREGGDGYVSSNRDETRYEVPIALSTGTPSTRRSARAGATSASAPPSPGSSSGSCSRRPSGASQRWSWRAGPSRRSRRSSTS